MLFNKKTENGMDYDCLSDTAARSANGLMPFNPGSQSLNVNGEVLRQRTGTAARSVIDAWLTMKEILRARATFRLTARFKATFAARSLLSARTPPSTATFLPPKW